jgi:hypothetical protein
MDDWSGQSPGVRGMRGGKTLEDGDGNRKSDDERMSEDDEDDDHVRVHALHRLFEERHGARLETCSEVVVLVVLVERESWLGGDDDDEGERKDGQKRKKSEIII